MCCVSTGFKSEMSSLITPAFFERDAATVAEALIGSFLKIDGVGGKIVETEAYGRDDPASHSFGGKTIRNSSMFGAAGTVYVYKSYGLHWCLNFVCEEASAVLIRALEPSSGLETMRLRRGTLNDRILCAGPGRLCQALAVTQHLDGRSVFSRPLCLSPRQGVMEVSKGPRIGISKATDLPWRFGALGSIYLSRGFPSPTC